jgi:hypothetical protein
LLQELDKAGARELARCHGKLAVLDLAATDDVADADVVGWIQKRHRRAGLPQQTRQVIGIARIAAQQAVMAQLPEITRLAQRGAIGPLRIDEVSRIGRILLKVGRDLIDLDRRKAGDRDVEVFDDQKLRQFGELGRQELAVPPRILRDLVVGQSQRAPLCFR